MLSGRAAPRFHARFTSRPGRPRRHNSQHVGPLGGGVNPQPSGPMTPTSALLPHSTLQHCDTRKPHEHSLDTQAYQAFISGPIPWTGCYDAKQ
ncbi:hypothetical protein HMPREF1138_0135 [Actinomyces sp. ICM58]|nr:hypothetical protein HMPREF1138_0135 [Actinomyces sp. ICM58]